MTYLWHVARVLTLLSLLVATLPITLVVAAVVLPIGALVAPRDTRRALEHARALLRGE